MRRYGLIGYPLGHSFSKDWFAEKFIRNAITDARYDNFPLDNIEKLIGLLAANPDIQGLNVTAPYKESVMKYLDDTDDTAQEIGAVNCIVIRNGNLKGYNTDWSAFSESLLELIGNNRPKALLLGTGGAAKAAGYTLRRLGIDYLSVSRTSRDKKDVITYGDITPEIINAHKLIINATPLGTYPETGNCPPIPYESLTTEHKLYDMVYNPPCTEFMKRGKQQDSAVINGLRMLELQAEKSWELFNS